MDTATVVTAVNEILAAAGVGVWRPAGPAYTLAEVGIFYGPIGAAPDRAVGVTVYVQSDDIETERKDRYVQVRCRGARGAPNGADLLADSVFYVLHGLVRTHGFARISRTSTAPLGADTNARQERTDNYRIIIDNPEAS